MGQTHTEAGRGTMLGQARALVVDDEPLARAHLAFLLREMGVGVVDEVRDGAQCLAHCRRREERPDWVFLDVRMPGMDGMAVADALRADVRDGSASPAVVFVTGYEDFAVQAFEREAVDYVLKPAARDRLAATLYRLVARPPGPESARNVLQRLPVRTDYAVRLLDTAQILAAAAHGRRVDIITEDAVYPTYYTLADLEGRLPAGEFMRVHDGWIVNLARIVEIHNLGSQTYQLTLRGSDRPVPVSRRRLRKLQDCLGL